MVVSEKNRLRLAPKGIQREIQSLIRILEARVQRASTPRWIDSSTRSSLSHSDARYSVAFHPWAPVSFVRSSPIYRSSVRSIGVESHLSWESRRSQDSGQKRGRRAVAGGLASVRSALYMAAMNAARFNPVYRPFYDRLLAAGKPPKVAIVSIARRLLVALNAMARDQSEWSPVA
jgi:transposase